MKFRKLVSCSVSISGNILQSGISKEGQPIVDIVGVKVKFWRKQIIFSIEFLFKIKLDHCLQHHQKEIEIQVDENEEEAFEKRSTFNL